VGNEAIGYEQAELSGLAVIEQLYVESNNVVSISVSHSQTHTIYVLASSWSGHTYA